MRTAYTVLFTLTGWPLVLVITGSALLLSVIVIRSLIDRFRQSTLGALIAALRRVIRSGEIDRWIDEPRSVSGLDSILIPRIARDFPTLNIDEMKNVAKRLLRATLESLESGKIKDLVNASETYRSKLRQMISDREEREIETTYENVIVHRVVISDYKKSAGSCRISFQIPFRAAYKEINREGAVIAGTDEHDSQLRCTMTMVYVQDIDQLPSGEQTAVTTNCPNCGAPLTELGSSSCRYCGSPVEPIHIRVWQFDDFLQD